MLHRNPSLAPVALAAATLAALCMHAAQAQQAGNAGEKALATVTVNAGATKNVTKTIDKVVCAV